MKRIQIFLVLCLLFSTVPSLSVSAQEKEVDTFGEFACLDTQIMKEVSESTTLEDIQWEMSKTRRLSINESGVGVIPPETKGMRK